MQITAGEVPSSGFQGKELAWTPLVTMFRKAESSTQAPWEGLYAVRSCVSDGPAGFIAPADVNVSDVKAYTAHHQKALRQLKLRSTFNYPEDGSRVRMIE